MRNPKYKAGDIVGVVGDAMYEFKIIEWLEEHKVYNGECTRSYMETIKVGDICAIRPNQIIMKLS